MERLDRLGHASSKADEGPRESPDAARLGRDPVVGAAPTTRCRAARERLRHGRLARDRPRDRAALRPRRREARRDRLPPQRHAPPRRRPRSCARSAPSRRSSAATSPRSACSTRSPRSARSTCSCTTPRPASSGPALETEDKHWDWTLNANARALLQLARVAAPQMPDGLVDRRDLVARRAARARELLARRHVEGGARGARPLPRRRARAARIRVNAVSGGVVETDALEHFPNREEMLARRRREPGRPARRARTTSPAPSRSSARRTPR